MTESNTIALFERLKNNNIDLRLEDGSLKVNGPKASLTSELLSELRDMKPELIRLLSQFNEGLGSIPESKRSDGCDAELSPMQYSLWLTHRFSPDSVAYNLPSALRLTGDLDIDRLETALGRAFWRHESLRYRFVDVSGQPRQILTDEPLPFSVVEAGSEEDVQVLLRAEARRVFNLESDPLFRAVVVRLAPSHHVLLLNMHHIVADGWSIEVLLRDIAIYYEGREPPTLGLQYRDYADWINQRLKAGIFNEAESYWKNELEGAPSLTEFPTDKRRPVVLGTKGASETFRICASLKEKLDSLSKQAGCTLFVTLMGAFQLLVHRYSGQDDIVIGAPVANRDRIELEPIVGYFVNPLPIRSRLFDDQSVLDYIREQKKRVFSCFDHQAFPFERIVDAVAPERSLSFPPLFQHMFSFQTGSDDGVPIAGIESEEIAPVDISSKYDLMLSLRLNSDGEIDGKVQFNVDLFTNKTAARIGENLTQLLRSMVADPEKPAVSLEFIAPEEAREIQGFNPGSGNVANEQAPYEMFLEQARLTPDRVAVQSGNLSITYDDLAKKAAIVANYLTAKGVKPGELIGLHCERSIGMIEAMFGIWLAGAAYVPLDPSYPDRRLSAILKDAEPKIVICDNDCTPVWLNKEFVVSLDELAQPISALSSVPAFSHDRLSHVIYTSGSTGLPKGVMVCHRNVAALLDWAHRTYSEEELARVAFATSICFDLSIFEILAPLTFGGSVLIYRDALALFEETGQPTLLNTVPSVLDILVKEGSIPPSVQVINVAGEALRKSLVNAALEQTSAKKVFNLYGPTEDTTYSTAAMFCEAITDEPTIGTPLPGTKAWVLDSHNQFVPIGAVGELSLSGMGVAAGYLGRSDLTRERFIPAVDGEGVMYRTGDLVRWNSSGQLVFLGRNDDQVKVSGFRIELGDVEAALRQVEAFDEIAVIAKATPSGHSQLVAFIVSGEAGADQDDKVSKWRRQLGKIVPDYMIPGAFVIIDALPRTANGKLDRSRLASEFRPTSGDSFVEPESDLERSICELFEETLGVEKVGAKDDFFHAGGNSILAIQLLSKINDRFRSGLTAKSIYEHRSVRQLSEYVAARDWDEHLPLHPTDKDKTAIAYPQLGAWGIANMEGFKTFYNMVNALRIRGELEVSHLRAALQSIIDRHASLRSTFRVDGTEIVLNVDSEFTLELRYENISQCDDISCEIDQAIRDEEITEFDLIRGPLCRARLLKLADRDHVFLLTIHHLVSDGWSMNVFKQELEEVYAAGRQARKAQLPKLDVSYNDFASCQREWHETDFIKTQARYWQSRFNCFSPSEFPLDFDVGANAPGTMHYLPVDLPDGLLKALELYANDRGVSLYCLSMAALHSALFLYSGSGHSMVYSPIAGRSHHSLEPLIGLFVNMVSIMSIAEGKMTLASLVDQLNKSIIDAQENADVAMVAMMQSGSIAPPSVPAIVLNFIDLPNAQPWRLDGLEVDTIERDKDGKPCLTALDLFFKRGRDAAEILIGYNTAQLKKSTAYKIANYYRLSLIALVQDDKKPLGRIAPEI